MDVKDESKIQDFHFQQWFGNIAPDTNIMSPTESQDQVLPTAVDADDHEDQMWNDPPDLFEHTSKQEQSNNTIAAPHAAQPVHQFSHPEPIAPQPSHDPRPTVRNTNTQPAMQIYSMPVNNGAAPTNGHPQMNTAQSTYYPNGVAYSTPMPQYTMTPNHQPPSAPSNPATYNSQYMSYGPSPRQVWQTNGGMVYTPNGQARPIPDSPVDPMLANSAASPPPPRATPPIYTHPQYTSSPVPSASHQLPPQQPNYAYTTWTPEQLQMLQQQRQQRPPEAQVMPSAPASTLAPAPAQPRSPYRAAVVPVQRPTMQHPRVQQTQNASPMPTMSPTMMHMGGSPVSYAGAYPDIFNAGSPAYAHSPNNPTAINPQALSQPLAVEPQPVNTVHLYKQYMQPQMMDAAPAETAKKLIARLTAENTPPTDPETRLWLLTRIRDGAGKEFFKTWANDPDAMSLIKEWLRAATPSKDGKADGENNAVEWQESIMPLLQVIDRLPLGINQLRKSKIGSNILKLSKNPPNGAIRDLASTLENRYRSLMESHQPPPAEDAKPMAGKRTEADTRGVKRKSETPPIKSGAPAKRAAIAQAPSPAALAAQRLKREKEKEARGAAGTVTKETKSDSSFFTDTKPKPLVKRVLPSFTKKSASTPASDIAQPSSRNTFEEALAHMGVKPKASTPTVPEPMEGVTLSASRAPSISLEPGKKRKRVTFRPEEQLVEVRWIEKAIYDDDPDAFGAHHSVRDLDRDEGASMHKQLVFEEQIDWSEPIALASDPEGQLQERGQQSEEAHIQAEREKTALLAHYQPGAIPPWPTEIPMPNVDDSQTKIMLAGEDIDSLSEKPASVAELLAKINTPAAAETPAAPPPMFESLKDLGIDPSTFTQMLQQHNIAPVVHPPEQTPPQPPSQPRYGSEWAGDRMMDGGAGGWNDHGSSGYLDEHSHRSRFEDRGRGRPPRGRGRGRPDNDRGQKVCYFYPLGKCKYGDQCHNLHVK